jgi:hypothetical protein
MCFLGRAGLEWRIVFLKITLDWNKLRNHPLWKYVYLAPRSNIIVVIELELQAFIERQVNLDIVMKRIKDFYLFWLLNARNKA